MLQGNLILACSLWYYYCRTAVFSQADCKHTILYYCRQCHGWYASLLISHHEGLGSILDHSVWDLWLTNWCQNKVFDSLCHYHTSNTPLFIIIFNLRTAAFKAYCAIWVRRSNFRHQVSPRVSPRESTQLWKVELWARNVWKFCLIADLHVTFRDLLHAGKLW